MKTIQYDGPEDKSDVSDYLVVGKVRLELGQPVKVDDDVAKAALDVEGYKVSEVKASEAKDAPDAQLTAGLTGTEAEAEGNDDTTVPAPAAGQSA